MPRKPSRSHPLRTARGILGLTQTQFAASVGTSAINLQQIENGIARMSPGLARRISVVYNLDPEQLLNGNDPDHPRLVLSHLPFTKESFERLNRVSPDEIKHRRRTLSFIQDLLFDAAHDKGRYNAFMFDVLDMLKKRATEFDLVEHAIHKLSTYGAYPEHPELTRQIFDMLFSAAPPEVVSFVEIRNKQRKEPMPALLRRSNFKPEPAEPQSSRSGKSPRTIALRPPRPDRGSAARKPSKTRRGRAPG
jgi:transcriptional regulator with XRE-family HTH domain